MTDRKIEAAVGEFKRLLGLGGTFIREGVCCTCCTRGMRGFSGKFWRWR